MVNFQLAATILFACQEVNAFHSNTIVSRRQRHIQVEANTRERDEIGGRANRFTQYVSYSVDGLNFVPAEDGTNEQSWVDATTKSILNGITEEQKAEDAAEEELDRRRQQLLQRGLGIKEGSYTVELSLISDVGMTVGQIVPGRILSTYELDLDSLKLQLTPSIEEINAEKSDTRIVRIRLEDIIPDFLNQVQLNLSGLVVTSVIQHSQAWEAGIRPGDLLSSISATLGDSLWPKSTLEGVQSAVSSRRNIVGAKSIKMKLMTSPVTDLSSVKSDSATQVGNQYELTLSRPLGFNIRESTDGSGYVEVASISENASNLVKYAMQPGDKIVALGSSIGDQFWPAPSTVEGVIGACTGRLPSQTISLRFDRPNANMKDVSTLTLESVATAERIISETKTATSSPTAIEELKSRCRKVLKRYATEETLLSQQWQRRSVEKFPAIVADKVVDALASVSADVDSYTLHMIMNAYLAGGKAKEAVRMFEAATGFAGDASIESTPSKVLGKDGTGHITPTETALTLYTCTALLRAHSMLGDFPAVQRVLLAMEGKSDTTIGDGVDVAPWPWTGALGSLKPDTVCYNIAIGAAENAGGADAITIAMELFGKMIPPTKKGMSTALTSDRPIQNQVSFNTLISALSKEGRSREAFSLFDRMQRLGLKPDKYTYTSLIKSCSSDGDLEELLYDMKARGVQPDVVMYNAMIKSLSEKREWTQATKLIYEMESKGVSPDSRTYSLLMNEMLKEDKPSACLALFEAASASVKTAALTENVYLYTIAISAASRLGDHQRALELIARMNARGVKPNIKTLTAVMGACMASKRPEVAVQIYNRIDQPDGYAMSQGIRAMCESGSLVEALEIMKRQNRSNRVMTGKETMRTYNDFLRASLEREEYELARRGFTDLLQKGFIPSKSIIQSFNSVFQLQDAQNSRSAPAERIESIDTPKFQFMLFVIDSIQQRNLPIDGSLFTSTVRLGNELAGLPRKIVSLMSTARSASTGGTTILDSSSDEKTTKEENKVKLTWEDVFLQYDSIDKDKLISESLPPLFVRIAPKDVRAVLQAEQATKYSNRGGKTIKLKSGKIIVRRTITTTTTVPTK